MIIYGNVNFEIVGRINEKKTHKCSLRWDYTDYNKHAFESVLPVEDMSIKVQVQEQNKMKS